MNRRGFLKGAAGLLSLPIVGKMASSVKSPMVREGIANVANVAQDVPIYFWKLVDKIKNLGKDVTETAGTADRQTVKQYKDFELTEDVATGEIQIFKTSQSDEAIDRFGGENATEERQIEAWQWLVDEKHVWKLQGWYGRTARDLINEGIIKE